MIELKLSLAEVNVILQALGNASYVQVYELVQKIQNQTKSQLNEKPIDEKK